VFKEQRAHGFDVWEEPLTTLRVPKIFNLRRDPFERADHDSISYREWQIRHLYIMHGAAALTQKFVSSFAHYPPRQKPGSFNVDAIMEQFGERVGQ